MAVPAIVLSCVFVMFAVGLTPERIQSFLPAKADSIKHLFFSGIQLLRILFIAAAGLLVFSVWFWSRWPLLTGSRIISPHHRHFRRDAALLVAVVFVSLALRVPNLNTAFWADELNTVVRIVDRGLPVIFAFSADGNNHLLNSLGMYIAGSVIGPYEWAVRIPSLTLSVLTPLAAYFLLSPLLSRRVALIAAVLFAVGFTCVVFANEARGYAGALLFVLLSCGIFALLTERPTRLLAVLYPLASAAAVGFVATAIYVVAAHIATATLLLSFHLWRGDRNSCIRKWGSVLIITVWGLVLSLLLVGVMVPQLMDYSFQRSHIAHAQMSFELIRSTLQFATGVKLWWIAAGLIMMAVGGWYTVRSKPEFILAFVGPLAVHFLAFGIQGSHGSPRVFVSVIPVVMIGLAAALGTLLRRDSVPYMALALTVIVLFIGGSLPHYVAYYRVGHPPLRQIAHALVGKKLLVTGWQADINGYYFPGAVVSSRWTADTATLLDEVVEGLRISQPEYVLDGCRCDDGPRQVLLDHGYHPLRMFLDWTATSPNLHPGHACFRLYTNTTNSQPSSI